ncbi:hypothetical protein KIF53_17640 [Chromobacterium subtsugae]|uniref:Uncharacterized protein n=2 Tax=Chromobacterium subtsugae TaxID=251747 RepID=A0ABS7FHA0_9NEIS|nr:MULTISPECIES: hypothetical protein [Chromobacterium]KUM03689.1 hypothetical protein Cv017_00855 [Chromobacterium subtsugae]KZE88327.1 hypothetical protein AWB61_00135 [Chromobacterium sp. F49]MBW8289460.1 hypothetical protein [Chromobacterium subtsugae]OBU85915.1 hypothetical protein MY55_13960 [Chromobacterium subtsugae]
MLEQAALDMAVKPRNPNEAGITKQERYMRNQAASHKQEAEKWLSDLTEKANGFNFLLCSAVIGDHLKLNNLPTDEIASQIRKAVLQAPSEMALVLSNLRRNMMNEVAPAQ